MSIAATTIPPLIADCQREAMTPVTAAERIETLDVLRGFALFGILVVNMAGFSWPIEYHFWQQKLSGSHLDTGLDWIVSLLAEGKFYPLFCFLFGLGAAIQMERADYRAGSFAGHFCRRLFVLLGFGLTHALLIWEGDILVWYALCGFLLLPFRHRQPTTILIWSLACLVIPALLTILFWVLLVGLSLVPELAPTIQQAMDGYYGTYEEQQAAVDDVIQVFAAGSYAEIFRERFGNLLYMWAAGIIYAPGLLGLFLLGLYVGKHRILQNVTAHTKLLRHTLIWGMIIGLPTSLFYTVAMMGGDLANSYFLWLLSYALTIVGGPAQSLAYAAVLVLLLQREWWRRWLRAFGHTGKMALSNYLLQSVICTTIFYSYGFGLFGAVGRATGLGLTVLIFVVQMGFSTWWLNRFQFGPMEWLWRTLTYGKCQPMRR